MGKALVTKQGVKPTKGDKGDAVISIYYISRGFDTLTTRQSTSVTKVTRHMCSEGFKRRVSSSFTVRILA